MKIPSYVLIIVGVICHSSISSSALAQYDSLYLDLVYEGVFPKNLWANQFKTGQLLEDQPEVLVTLDSVGFQVFEFMGDFSWKMLCGLPFILDVNQHVDSRPTWIIGNLDSKHADEIITWSGKTVVQIKAENDSLIAHSYQFPYIVQQGLIGDLDNDGVDELVTFCLDQSLYRYSEIHEGRVVGGKLRLCIARLDSGKLNLVWTDGGNLGYAWTIVVPPDRLVLISPFPDGKDNLLLVSRSQSDMSTTTYDLLAWNGNRLALLKTFQIFGGRLLGVDQWPEYSAKPRSRQSAVRRPLPSNWTGRASISDPSMCGALQIIEIGGRRAFLGTQAGRGENVVLVPADDRFEVKHLVWSDFYQSITPGWFWMDPEGRGRGFLGCTYSYKHVPGHSIADLKWHYFFYRLREAY